jgi:CheY-like chemotaxis protein
MRRILVIEDNAEIRENVAELLALEGYEVSSASNGKDGIDTALREKPDVVLCDVSMPELDGYGVLHQLRAIDHVKDVPLIFLTARAEKTDIQLGLQEGANGYLVKPFMAEQLLRVIASCLKKKNT